MFFCLADCNSNSFQERISNSFLYTAYIHTCLSSTQNNQASWKKKPYFLFLFKPKQTCTVTFKSLLKIAPSFLQRVCCRYESCSFPFQLCFFLLKLNLLSVQARGWLSTMIYWGDGCPLPHSLQHLHPHFVFANFIFRRIYTQSSYINSLGDKSVTYLHKQKLLLASCLPFFLKVKRKKP